MSMKQFLSAVLISFLALGSVGAQELFPKLKGFVTDEAGLLNSSEVASLNDDLQSFAQNTSNEIVVYITNDLHGYEKAEYAFELANKNGIGKKEKENGVLILIKSKTSLSKGEIFIATGYGLEGAIPDALANQIIDNEIIPEFKQNRYYLGLNKGLDVLKKLAKGEINEKQYRESRKKEGGSWFFLVLVLAFILFNLFRARGVRGYANRNNIGFWAAWALMNSSRSGGIGSSSNSFSNFSSGSGSFGGFGGGSFGGGGAGGSW